MIVKSKRWKSPQAFGKLVEYIRQGRAGEEGGFEITHNLNPTRDLNAQFQENDHYRKQRKNGVAVYHEILSFHAGDREHLMRPVLEDLTRKYIALRGANALCFAAAHLSQPHVHIHLVFSGTEYRSAQTLRLDNAAFRRIRREIERYQAERYPQLEHSLVYLKDRQQSKEKRPSERETQLRKRVGERRPTQKDQLAHMVTECYAQAPDLSAFIQRLTEHGIEVYARGTSGKLTGIIARNRKWRFRTLSAPLEAAIRREEEITRLMEQSACQCESERDRGRERTRQPKHE